MQATIKTSTASKGQQCKVLLADKKKSILKYFDKDEESLVLKKLANEQRVVVNAPGSFTAFYLPPESDSSGEALEKARNFGFEVQEKLKDESFDRLFIQSEWESSELLLAFLEGYQLGAYRFNKYKTEKKENSIKELLVQSDHISDKEIQELQNLVRAVYYARDLVNEPVITLTAEELAKEIQSTGKASGFKVDVFNLSKIRSFKMGGLLAVNSGSPLPPTFSILEYSPKKPLNEKPIVLVGKGVVFDTGGLSLKPTPNSMDFMKCDMAGAAAVVGVMKALADNNIPVKVVGLIPATDNRPGQNAITPGDVITMYNGKTVEILNTDAEGRLILGDALAYAEKFDPLLVIDLATLTGSALAAIGHEGMVYMGTADKETKNILEGCGLQVHERLVEFPLWKEYGKQIESDIADLKNLGGPYAGAITAGYFLSHFTNRPWLHLDIVGPAFLKSPDNYRGKNGTGTGVRLMYEFIKRIASKKHGKTQKK
jgi:leucyl aminopeptidase